MNVVIVISFTLAMTAFFLLAMALGAGFVYLVVLGTLPPGLALASVLSASIAGVIMTAVEDGRGGLKLMLSSGMNPGSLDNYWGYGVVLVVVAAIIVITTGPKNLSRKYERVQHRSTTG